MKKKIKLFLVDDDAVFLKLLEIEFRQHTDTDIDIRTFATGESCMENIGECPDVIILDYHLDGIDKNSMNGIETLDKIKDFDAEIPVIILSSQDKIEVAVNCMHHKAFDYVVKSETAFFRLKRDIKSILGIKKMENELNWYMERM